MNRLLKQAYDKMDVFTHIIISIRNIVNKTLKYTRSSLQITLATYHAVMNIQRSLATPLEQYSLIQEPVILEDAVGRIAPVHLQFITSWKAFNLVLRVRFEGLRGYGKVKRGEFVLQERATTRDINRTIPWEAAFRPGQIIEMSLVFLELVKVVKLPDGSGDQKQNENICPNCQTDPGACDALDILW